MSASVVNQGLCAYYQQKHDAIPKSYETFPYARNGMGNLQTNVRIPDMTLTYLHSNSYTAIRGLKLFVCIPISSLRKRIERDFISRNQSITGLISLLT